MLPTSMARTESETEAATMSPLLVLFDELFEPAAVALGPDEPLFEPDLAPDEPAEVAVGADVDCGRRRNAVSLRILKQRRACRSTSSRSTSHPYLVTQSRRREELGRLIRFAVRRSRNARRPGQRLRPSERLGLRPRRRLSVRAGVDADGVLQVAVAFEKDVVLVRCGHVCGAGRASMTTRKGVSDGSELAKAH